MELKFFEFVTKIYKVFEILISFDVGMKKSTNVKACLIEVEIYYCKFSKDPSSRFFMIS